MKIYSELPDGNEMAVNEPARYFNLAIKQIKEISGWLQTSNENGQPLLVHLDVLIYLSKKYPDMAKERLEDVDTSASHKNFYDWYERCSSKIPAKFRNGIKASADSLFAELEKLKKL